MERESTVRASRIYNLPHTIVPAAATRRRRRCPTRRGGGISTEAKKREVLQLLKDYRPFHSNFGGAMPLEDTGVVDASYGPAGYVEAGAGFDERDVKLLAESYGHLEDVLTVLAGDGHEGRACYLLLLSPYLGDPADPSIVSEWRRKRPGAAAWHDLAVEKLVGYLRRKDLHVVWPKRMTGQQEREIDRRNDEFYRLFRELRGEGRGKTSAVKTATAITGYSERRGWQIVQAREGPA